MYVYTYTKLKLAYGQQYKEMIDMLLEAVCYIALSLSALILVWLAVDSIQLLRR